MKDTLWCKILGHRFLQFQRKYYGANKIGTIDLPGYDYETLKTPIGFCSRCGLTKEELGITPHKDTV